LSSTNGHAIQISGQNNATQGVDLEIYSGSVSVGTDAKLNDATLGVVIDDIDIGYEDSATSDADIWIGQFTSIDTGSGRVIQNGGQVLWQLKEASAGSVTSYQLNAGTMTFKSPFGSPGGEDITVVGIESGATLNFIRGVGLLGTITVQDGGTLDMRRGVGSAGVTKVIPHRGFKIFDPGGLLNPSGGFDFIDTYPGDSANTLVWPRNQNWDNTGL